MVERGFGFIRCLDGEHAGEDCFFHMSGVVADCSIADLPVGTAVVFDIVLAPKGLRAERVEPEL